jgi:hypothetical protein
MFDSACKAFKVPDTLVVEPGKNHGYGMDGIWPDALKNWMLKRGLLTKPVGTGPFQAKKRSVESICSMRYSPARGIYIARSMVRPDVIRILTIVGTCLATYTGTLAGEFSWKPRTGGIYFVQIQAGKDVSVAKIICAGK